MIINSEREDLNIIFKLYDDAVAYQKLKFNKHWKGFDREMVEQELDEQRQWKILDDAGNIMCIFALTYNDPFIWGDKDMQPAIYIHRIVTHPDHHGKNLVKDIVAWARIFAKENNKQFIRMDTWGDNEKLIQYYTGCGFTFLGITTPESATLPKHYTGITLSLFEIAV